MTSRPAVFNFCGVPIPAGFYAQWRARAEERLSMADRASSPPPERLLQGIWFNQRLRRSQLQTLDGRSLRVLHPGFWNHESGPDFRDAVLQFQGEDPRSGDVEVDPLPHHWRAHQHHVNPAFTNVILHVVWSGESGGAENIPALSLEKYIDAPLEDIDRITVNGASESWPPELLGACCAPMNRLSADQIAALLRQAARIRFERKAADFHIRARDSGWEQALWEGLFRALGYKQNIWPMRRLAELLPALKRDACDVLQLQARLMGVSSLLPSQMPRNQNPCSRAMWDYWWRERESYRDITLPKTLWRFNGLRPANQPQRRLALAAHWLASTNFFGKLENWFASATNSASAPETLLDCLQPPADDFWSWHWGLGTARLSKPQPLLGASRAGDLAVNVILPWYWARAKSGQRESLAELAWDRYLAWPAAQDNSVLLMARQRLMGANRFPAGMNSAAAQQGLLQIVRDFCDHSNAICADCRFPDLVTAAAVS